MSGCQEEWEGIVGEDCGGDGVDEDGVGEYIQEVKVVLLENHDL